MSIQNKSRKGKMRRDWMKVKPGLGIVSNKARLTGRTACKDYNPTSRALTQTTSQATNAM
jgi:hypothetical protein